MPEQQERYPHLVVRWQNNAVMVFDQYGEQMPELQGNYVEVRDKVKAAARADTEFTCGLWQHGMIEETPGDVW